jgi:D-alanyl-D-alanine carboxypeptidase
VVLGASSGQMRAVRAAQLLERGFSNDSLSWLRPSLGTVNNLAPIDASPPNLHEEMCGSKHKRPASDEDEESIASGSPSGASAITFFAAGLQPPMIKPSELLAAPAAASEPIPVYTGPTRTGAALIAAVAADVEQQTPQHRGKKSKVAAKKSDSAAEPNAEGKDAKSEAAAKPAAGKHAKAKPEAAPKASEKSAAEADTPAAKPTKPKAAAKHPTKPAPKTGEAKPVDQKTDPAPHT